MLHVRLMPGKNTVKRLVQEPSAFRKRLGLGLPGFTNFSTVRTYVYVYVFVRVYLGCVYMCMRACVCVCGHAID